MSALERLEKFEAHRMADIKVKEALIKYKMNDVVNLNDEIKSVLNEAILDIINSSELNEQKNIILYLDFEQVLLYCSIKI